ncbi:hypothetical protein [Pantoea sp. AMG 501]|nr:hypothetical protein [Pantoea sp. AMG 501]
MRRIAFIAAGCFLGAFSSASVADESGEGKRKNIPSLWDMFIQTYQEV